MSGRPNSSQVYYDSRADCRKQVLRASTTLVGMSNVEGRMHFAASHSAASHSAASHSAAPHSAASYSLMNVEQV